MCRSLCILRRPSQERTGSISERWGQGEQPAADAKCEPQVRQAYLGVYTTPSLVEQATPTAFEISGGSTIVTNIAFPDHDLDLEDLGSTLSWKPLAWRQDTVRAAPQRDIRTSRAVRLYWSVGAWGANSVLPFLDVPLGTDQVLKPLDTALASFTHLVAYTVSTLVKQATPVALVISDTESVVGKVCCPARILTPTSLAAHRHGKSQTRSAA